MIRRRETGGLIALAVVLGMGPTVGDVGACGATATPLDEGAFSHARKVSDCERCAECGLATDRCKRACDPKQPGEAYFPVTCHPLHHDGEVCLRALAAASCADYAGYVDDVAPTTPTECDFCRLVPDAAGPE